jgi:hypothetical protein
MKIKYIGKRLAVITGKPHELKPLELLCDNTHHIHKNPTGRKDKPKTCGTCSGWTSRNNMDGKGNCDRGCGVGGVTNIFDDCDEWRDR